MAFMIETRDMPRIYDWKSAEKWFTETRLPGRKEWREHSNARPLASPRAFHKRIVKNGDDYELTLYSTPLVTYHKDGSVTSVQHDTASSQAFHWRMRPESMYYRKASGGKVLLCLNADSPNFMEFVQGNRIKMKWEDGLWKVVSGAEQRVREYLKHAEARAAAKKLKPLFTWYDASVKLGYKFPLMDAGRHAVMDRLHCLEDPEQYVEFGPFLHDKPKFREAYYDALGLYEKRPIPNTEHPVRQRCWSCT